MTKLKLGLISCCLLFGYLNTFQLNKFYANTLKTNYENLSNSNEKIIPIKNVTIKISSDKLIARINENFLSFAIDMSQVIGGNWWSPDGKVSAGVGTNKIKPFDFSNKKLSNLTKELSPAYLRIGGSEADKVYYDLDNKFHGKVPEKYEFIMNHEQWGSINSFAKKNGLQVMFTLNAGPASRDKNKNWISDNAKELMKYTKDKKYPVSIWELGNEINAFQIIHGFNFRITGEQYNKDIWTAKKLIHQLGTHTLLAGPSSAYWPVIGEPFPVMNKFMENGSKNVDIITWHYYPQQSRRCAVATRRASPYLMLEPSNLDEINKWANQVENEQKKYAKNSEVWLGETGNAQCGGEPGVSDTFIGGFWWLDQLGLMAKRGQQVVIRQTLVGSNYGMLDETNLEPNPDYWNSILWKRLMSSKVIQAEVNKKESFIRTYAHCTPERYSNYKKGSVTLLAVNLDRKHSVRFNFDGIISKQKEVYKISTTDLLSKNIFLNNKILKLRTDNLLPDLKPEITNGDYIDIAPASYAFIIFPDANATSCK